MKRRRPWRHNITLQLSLLILTNEEKGRCNIWPADYSRIWKSRVPIYQDTMFSSHFNNKPSCMKRKTDNIRIAKHYIIIIIFIEKYQQRKKWKPHDVITHKTHTSFASCSFKIMFYNYKLLFNWNWEIGFQRMIICF